jgi:hypothetical protein
MKKLAISSLLLLVIVSCQRETADLQPPDFSTNPNVFLDGFSAGLNYAAFGGSVPAAFQVDNEVTYNNTAASMRFEVPDPNDSRGAYAGGVFFTSTGRNLTQYTALTFWAKSSVAANLDLIGFGADLGASAYQVSISNVPLNSNWQKFYIPIPDASKLTAEKGMLFYAEGPENNRGYTFWIDEVKFENLGTVAHLKHFILDGANRQETSFAGISKKIDGLSSTANLPNGSNIKLTLTPQYFTFISSDTGIATVSKTGDVLVTGGPGLAVVTAKVGNIEAGGKLTIDSKGVFQKAPTPTQNAADVISLFSNAYTNVPVDYYNGYWAPFQTTLSADFTIDGDDILQYTNFNFVGIQFSTPTINASQMNTLHLDVYFPAALAAGAQFRIEMVDFGANGAFGGGDDKSHKLTIPSGSWTPGKWFSLALPLSSFSTLTSKARLGQLIFEGTGVSSFYADNIYFHK